MDLNQKFRLALLAKWPSQLDAAKALGIDACSLSLLMRGHRHLTRNQRAKLRKHFSDWKIRRMFPARVESGESDPILNQ